VSPNIADATTDDLVARARALIRQGERVLLGVTGSPGAGKTTLAKTLVHELNLGRCDNPPAVYLPMDGFHLANRTLQSLGIHDRKGAIDTFDGWGFVGLLRRLLAELDHPVYAPSFERAVDEPVAAELTIPAGTPLVVVEGNYLLVETPPWDQVKPLLAQTWFCVTPEERRLTRLIERHTRHGRSTQAATAWATNVDGANAGLIEATRHRADLLISGEIPGLR
jgi:pantothenate kinase